jgi:hypothetical protein
VELFTLEEIASQLEDLVPAYRHFHLHWKGMEISDKSDQEAKADYEAGANQARDTFLSMFPGRINEDQLISESEEYILTQLKSWAQELLPSSIGGTTTGLTLEECSDLLTDLSSQRSMAEGPPRWPYIKGIKYEGFQKLATARNLQSPGYSWTVTFSVRVSYSSTYQVCRCRFSTNMLS